MFKPCPNCGFLVALIAGREASQRCPRCGSAMLEDGELPPVEEAPARRPVPRVIRDASTASPIEPERVAAGSGAGVADRTPAVAPREAEVIPVPDAAVIPRPEDVPSPAAGQAAPNAAPAADTQAALPVDDAQGRGAAAANDAPSFAARRARVQRRRGRRWPWAVALPLLALLLALQLLLSQRAELAQDARWRPLVTGVCDVMGCDIPAWREPRAFAMLARNVRPHPARDGVLHVTTSLRNDAAWPQPLPVVVLSLSDVDGRVLAARAVTPAEYGRDAGALVDPRESVDIAFDVREPSPRVVSFDFELR